MVQNLCLFVIVLEREDVAAVWRDPEGRGAPGERPPARSVPGGGRRKQRAVGSMEFAEHWGECPRRRG